MQWVVTSAEYKLKYGKPYVCLFSRNVENVNETTVHEVFHEPYFYVPSNEIDITLPNGCKYDDNIVIDALGRNVVKVIVDKPSTVPQIRDFYSFSDESDVLFPKRFLYDYGIYYSYDDKFKPITVERPITPRVLWFDIEVRSPKGIMPLPKDAKYPIVSIQCMDSYTKMKIVLTHGIEQIRDEQINCNSEIEMFKAFYEILKQWDPDILSGWYTNQYDIPYIINRSEIIGISNKGLSRLRECRISLRKDGKYSVNIPGRQCFDLQDGFKAITRGESQRSAYDLKSISAECGFPYKDYGPYIDDLFNRKDYDTFIDYCINDLISLETIDKSKGIIEFFEYVRMICGSFITDTPHNSILIESLLMHQDEMKPMPRRNYTSIEDPFDGAYVLLPPAGIHKHVQSVDASALYPTIMLGFPDKCKSDIDGIAIKMLEKIVNEREMLREMRKKDPSNKNIKLREVCMKMLANSYYGVQGATSWRLYNRNTAEFVTSTGQEVVKYIKHHCELLGKEVIYIDTDSCLFKGSKSVEEGIQIEKYLNEKLKEWSISKGSNRIFTLKFEKYYRTLLFKRDPKKHKNEGVKKKYVGHLIWEEGNVKSELNFKGIELTRSDSSELTKRILRKFLEMILIQDDINGARQFIKQTYKDVESGNVSLLDISLPRDIRKVDDKENPWKRGKYNTKLLFNYNIPDGVKPRLVYLKCSPYEICIDDEIDIGEWKHKIDWSKTLEKTITKKIRDYAESANISWDNVIHGQKSLDAFF